MNAILDRLGLARERFRRRDGHKPGLEDVSTMAAGRTFIARPNFYYFVACGRPCWLPIYPSPEVTKALNIGWPCEEYRPHDKHVGPHCYSRSPREGDWVQVIGQVRGQELRDELNNKSDIWNIVRILPSARAKKPGQGPTPKIGYAADLWLGNTGWHGIPYEA